MSLDYRTSGIADHETVCYDGEGNLKPITQEIVFNCIRIEMGEITEENADEFYARLKFMFKLHGSMWQLKGGKQLEVKPEDVIAHIGLKTNVSTVHRQRWLTRKGGQVMGPIDDDAKEFRFTFAGVA